MIFILIGISAPVVRSVCSSVLRFVGLTPVGMLRRHRPPVGRAAAAGRLGHHMILPWLTFAILFAASCAG
jgi:hypothetical protein